MSVLRADSGEVIAIDARLVVGRDAMQCNFLLNEPFISRIQAEIVPHGDGRVTINNLSSRMTTFVNGRAVTSIELNDGDRVEFGAGKTVGFVFSGSRSAQEVHGGPGNLFPVSSGECETVQKNGLGMGHQQDRGYGGKPRLRIGRLPDNDVVLASASVSRYHAEIIYDAGPLPMITDIGSTNGTFVNGQLLRGTQVLQPTDWVTIGGYLLKIDGRNIQRHDLSTSRLTAFGVSKTFGEKIVLNEVSVAFYPKEFVGLMGASGCGKSTLMDVLNGMRPATSGAVYVNDLDLYQNFDLMRHSIGYVPQRDILHEALSVERTLYYAGKMRLPSGSTEQQIKEAIDEVIETVGLGEQRHNAFKELSGGQQKRLSLGIELITKPNFLFLDEPTSPLDPETTEAMMILFRRLADEGRIVVMVTHKFEKFNLMHNIVLLTKGGRLAYFGPPQSALEYFGCSEPGEIYRRMHEKTPEETELAFKQSPHYKQFVASRFSEMQELFSAGTMASNPALSQTGAERKFGFGQWLTLTRRAFEIKLKDLRNTLILLIQAPLVALILAAITDKTPNDARTIFIAAVVSMWLGANNAIREIVSEIEVYARERLVNLKIPSYVLSKFCVLCAIGFLQIFMFVAILTVFERFRGGDFPVVMLVLYLTLLAGAATGLFFSALVKSTEKAMSILPLILIPQLLLSGFLKPIDNIYVNIKEEKPATLSDYDEYQRNKDKKPKIDPARPTEIPDIHPIQKSDGLGKADFLAALMTTRWTIDALTHHVSIDDTKARDKLASRVTVTEYKKVLDGKNSSEVESAYASRVRKDILILFLFSLVFVALTMGALKRKDTL